MAIKPTFVKLLRDLPDRRVLAGMVENALYDYSSAGEPVNAQVVNVLIERSSPTVSQREKMKAHALEGCRDQAMRGSREGAIEYARVVQYLSR